LFNVPHQTPFFYEENGKTAILYRHMLSGYFSNIKLATLRGQPATVY